VWDKESCDLVFLANGWCKSECLSNAPAPVPNGYDRGIPSRVRVRLADRSRSSSFRNLDDGRRVNEGLVVAEATVANSPSMPATALRCSLLLNHTSSLTPCDTSMYVRGRRRRVGDIVGGGGRFEGLRF
jgi:hypothetical protein